MQEIYAYLHSMEPGCSGCGARQCTNKYNRQVPVHKASSLLNFTHTRNPLYYSTVLHVHVKLTKHVGCVYIYNILLHDFAHTNYDLFTQLNRVNTRNFA
jgi:hypothetical protein